MIGASFLPWIIVIFFAGGVASWIAARWGPVWPRVVSLIVLIGNMGPLIGLWVEHARRVEFSTGSTWLYLYQAPWIPRFGISFLLGMDGLSLLLVILSNLLGIVAVVASWNVIRERVGFFHFNLLACISAFAAIFMALDMFLFYFAWEAMLLPLYFLIAIWGHKERRIYAALKFFIFTQASGLFMLLSIIGLYVIHGRATGVYTFDYRQLLGTPMSSGMSLLLMLGFFFAFAVKLPIVPFHTWLPDAHTEAPTAASVDLAGLVLKVGAYGFLRFLIPLFPDSAFRIAPIAMALGVLSIIYGASLSFAQRDAKRLVAYSSVSHMGFVILGIFSWNQLALQGAFMVMLAHGLSTGGLFVLVGDLYERTHTREMDRLGGLWKVLPRMGGTAMVLTMASLGLPGLANFVGEFLVLLGAYRANLPLAVAATFGFVVSTIYALWMMQRIFHGAPVMPAAETRTWRDMTAREGANLGVLVAILLWLGIYPQTELNTSRRAMEELQSITRAAPTSTAPADSSSFPARTPPTAMRDPLPARGAETAGP